MGTTIAAIASPPGGGARGILRLSGPRAGEIVRGVWRGPAPDLSRRGIHLGRFRDRRGEQPLLLLWMPGPRSFTREDVAEFHLPGSPPLLEAGLARLLDLGAMTAAPGEFTRRAFLSGRIDLTRAEGVLALVTAQNESERRAGCALLAGGLAERVSELRGRLEGLRALVEASLDFDPRETGHVPSDEIAAGLRGARSALEEALAFETVRAGRSGEPRIVLTGAPNAGKSALFNRLARARSHGEGAIVSPAAGTTRDVLEAEVDLGGVRCRLLDTAGQIESPASGPVERAAQAAGASARDSADLLLHVVDAASPAPGSPPGRASILVWNKIDLPGAPPRPPTEEFPWVAISAERGIGIEALRAAAARSLQGEPGEGTGLSRELFLRHREALLNATRALDHGQAEWEAGAPLEILAEELASATFGLDDISGRTTSEAVLERIFARFCVGK